MINGQVSDSFGAILSLLTPGLALFLADRCFRTCFFKFRKAASCFPFRRPKTSLCKVEFKLSSTSATSLVMLFLQLKFPYQQNMTEACYFKCKWPHFFIFPSQSSSDSVWLPPEVLQLLIQSFAFTFRTVTPNVEFTVLKIWHKPGSTVLDPWVDYFRCETALNFC